uniref:uncharacterized protein LOC114674302 isoform X1 n=1 Tax=Macaca mulatta TaxID=9544 RepID=UPI0010A23C71|nr:uncharacterized protein LOC114674302 isoform X1 [Macaca mulatta]
MAQDPKAGPAQPGQKRQQGTRVFWVYEYQRIRMPTLINHMPVKIRRAHMGMGVRSGFSPQRVSRNSPLPSGQKKFPTEDLHDIQGALWQIKAQVDSLLQSLERMDRQQVPPAGLIPMFCGSPAFPTPEDARCLGPCLCLSLSSGLPPRSTLPTPHPWAVLDSQGLLWLLSHPHPLSNRLETEPHVPAHLFLALLSLRGPRSLLGIKWPLWGQLGPPNPAID